MTVPKPIYMDRRVLPYNTTVNQKTKQKNRTEKIISLISPQVQVDEKEWVIQPPNKNKSR